MVEKFTGNFTQQEPLPDEAIEAAISVMRHGRLHRYNLADGEAGETALLEQEYAAYVGSQYCLAVASGGYAMATALRACGFGPGDKILTNAFTLAPVPGSIANIAAEPVLVEVTENMVLDLDDLSKKIASSGSKCLMLSHMRGHIVDMPALMSICDAADVTVIEDCAHTMGADWNGKKSGTWGKVGCYSTQTFKHINSGEGGLLVTDDAEVMARATMLSGSYMLFERHLAGASKDVFDDIRFETPNCSGRMDNLRAAILRPQIADLDRQCERWNALYWRLDEGLAGTPGLSRPTRPEEEGFVASSYQFRVPEFDQDTCRDLLKRCGARGVELKWFGPDDPVGFTSRHVSWRYVEPQELPKTDQVLAGLMDLRLPLTFSLEDCDVIARIIRAEVGALYQAA